MKQTLQSILTASDAALFPDISKSCSQNSVLCVTESDVFRCNEEIAVFLQDPDFQNRLCKQDFVDILFVLKGNCTCKFYKTDLTIAPESVFLSRHSFCMIPHQVIHSFSPDHGCQILHIFFKLDSLRSHYSDLISANNALLLFFSNMLYQSHYWNYLYFSVSYTDKLDTLLTEMYEEFHHKQIFHQNMLYYSSGTLFTLMERQLFSQISVSPSNPLRLVRYDQIYSYICDNYPMTSAREIAEYFHISQSYLCKLFHENGTTVTTVIQEIRLQQTRSLLEQSDLSIQNIAELVGYHDLTYFIKLFKRNFSITPYQYRKKYQSAKNLSQSTES